MIRFADPEGVSVDVLIASSGIEAEIVRDAEVLEVLPQRVMPVARVGHLIALKLLSVAPGRETDAADLRALSKIADDSEWRRAEDAAALIVERGYSRERDLMADLAQLRTMSQGD